MAEQLKSYGKCIFCNKEFSKSAISRHLQTHLSKKVKEAMAGTSFYIKIEQHPQWGVAPYFLHVWADGDATFKDVDVYLRGIWLECCGHLSSFKKEEARRQKHWDYFEAEDLLARGKVKDYEKLMEEGIGEIPMSRKLKDALAIGNKLQYDYDFGSTTSLLLTVVNQYPIKADKAMLLLSRNEPLKQYCDYCKTSPATLVCTVCMGVAAESMFCKRCAKKHAKTCSDFADYAAMPIVNSPRTGVCGYEGGSIDLERDVFTKKKIQ